MPIVVHLCEYGSLNGGENSLLSLLPLSDERAIILGPPEGPFAEAVRSLGIEYLPFQFYGDDGLRLPLGALREQLAEILRSIRPDIFHANSLSMSRLGGPVVSELGIPSLGHIRDIVKLNHQAVDDLNRCTRILAVSEAVKSFHLSQGLTLERTHVMYNGVDTGRFAPAEKSGYLHRELGIRPENRLLACIGQISLRKAQDVLLEAFMKIEDKTVSLLIIGKRFSEKAESLEFERKLHGLADGRVHFCGVRDDLERVYPELTAFVHPARQEPLGRVLLEAASCACPVIATDVGGTREIFHGESALFVPPSEPKILAQKIVELLGDSALRKIISANSRTGIETRFTRELAAAELNRHYAETSWQAAEK